MCVSKRIERSAGRYTISGFWLPISNDFCDVEIAVYVRIYSTAVPVVQFDVSARSTV